LRHILYDRYRKTFFGFFIDCGGASYRSFRHKRLPNDEFQPISFVWKEQLAVTVSKILEVSVKIVSGKAPDPNGIAGRVVKMHILAILWTRTFSVLLKDGHFSSEWKIARLIFLKNQSS